MFKVLHSSAGAGKTHALVKHYLLLSLHGPDPSAYSHILALTFTNKAAAEMRERVLTYLEALASGRPLDGAKADVRDSVMSKAGITEAELHRRAKAMLSHMLHHWPQVAVSTLDSFTRRVVMPFSRDLQLDHELQMTTEEKYYRAKAVDLLLEEAGHDKALTDILVATCEQLLEDERSWRPDQPLLDLSVQLTKENALEHLATLREMDSTQFLELYKRLRKRTETFRARMRKLGADACDAIERAALTDKDLANGKGGFISYLRKLRAFDGPFEIGKNVTKTLESDKWHSGSATPSAISAIEGLVPMFRTTIATVEALRDTEVRDYFIIKAITDDLIATASLNS
ncbi:MAG: UvrD-helicase domain-containing protein, partial [Flavobacteriales bacterium]